MKAPAKAGSDLSPRLKKEGQDEEIHLFISSTDRVFCFELVRQRRYRRLSSLHGADARKVVYHAEDLNTGTLHGSVTLKGTNGQIICTYYINNGSGWTFDTSTVLKITPTAILMIGSYDGTDLWATLPTVTIPRHVTLNQPYYYNGIMKNQRTHVTKPFTQIVRVTKTGLTVHTSGGTFTNCIMFQNYEYSPGSSDIVTILYAQGRAEVERWGCAIQDTSNPQQNTQTAWNDEIIRFGDSNPPLFQ